jgi:DMSO/TMAO reductase YedYZ molybdopterin-dependent catalytic subunit
MSLAKMGPTEIIGESRGKSGSILRVARSVDGSSSHTLLATHLSGKPLTVERGAPLRLLEPAKLGLKNIKAITRITNTKDEPEDYWQIAGIQAKDEIRIPKDGSQSA